MKQSSGLHCPKVTIGMPVCNGGRLVTRALDSLLAQTFTDFELIVSDNSSTDDTSEICRRYSEQDQRMKFFQQTDNIGALPNFQFVLDRAIGEYFFFAPHDDFWHKDYVSSAVEALDRNRSASLALGRIEYLDKKNEVFLIDQPPYSLNGDAADRIRRYVSTKYTDCMMYGVFRTDAIRDFRFATDGLAAERELIVVALLNGQVADTPGMLYRNYFSFKTLAEVKSFIGLSNSLRADLRDHLRCVGRIKRHFGWFKGLPLVWFYMIHRFPFISRIGRGRIGEAAGRRFVKSPAGV